MIGTADTLIAMAVILSAIVSIIGTGARRQAVEEDRARAADLCELTGILDPGVLQDVFGPPTMNGIYFTSLERVKQVRTKLSYLISDDRLDLVCIAIAVLVYLVKHPLIDLLLIMATCYQLVGWFVSFRLPGRQQK